MQKASQSFFYKYFKDKTPYVLNEIDVNFALAI